MNIITHAQSGTLEFPPSGGLREILLGAPLTLQAVGQRIDSVELVGEPENPPVIEVSESRPVKASLTFSAPGRYRFRIIGTDGAEAGLDVCACEPEALAALVNQSRTGHGATDANNVLRSLARNAPWFNGKRTDLHNRSLQEFGG